MGTGNTNAIDLASVLPYSELQQHREAMGRFGQGLKAIEAVAQQLIP